MANGTGGTVGKVLGSVIGVASQGNILLAGVVQAIVLYRQARDAWRAAHPPKPDGDDPDVGERADWKEDADLIDLLQQDSTKLVAHATQLLDKYKAAPPATDG